MTDDAEPGALALALLRAALGVLAGLVIIQAALGFAGALPVAPFVAALALLLAAVVWCLRARARTGGNLPTGRATAAVAAALIVAFAERAWAGLHRTTFLYDVLSYHLHVPAAWRAAGRLVLVPTPFGDPAPGYTPANAELIYGLALAATNNATLAHVGQLPFAALAVLAIYTTARHVGATVAAGLAAGLAFLLVPEVWQQAPTAMADLPMAACFLSSLPFLLRLERARTWVDAGALGIALGLLLGMKYVSVVVSLPLLLWAAFALSPMGKRRTADGFEPSVVFTVAVLLGAVFASGGFWYLRNAILTGNAIFPATISAGTHTFARGLLDGAALRASEYHVPVTDLGALGELLGESGWGFCAAVVAAGWLARRSRWPVLVVVVTALLWCGVPYQQSRFFFAVWGLGAIALAAASVRSPRAGTALLLLATAGSVLQFPTAGRLAPAAIAVIAALVAARVPASVVRRVMARAELRGRGARVGLAAAVVIVLAATIAWARAQSSPPRYAVGDDHDAAWEWMGTHARGVRVAYTGSNLPLPLWGPHFENVVRYVPIGGGLDSAPHQFLYVAPPAADETPSEPAPERRIPDRAAWLANVDAFAADWLFVARMYHGVARANLRDSDDFPIERVWADALPERFAPEYATAGVRIYRVRRP